MLVVLTLLPSLVTAITIPSVKAEETQSQWSTLASMPTARAGFGLAVVNGKIYAIGGVNGNGEPLNTVEEYNPVTNSWTKKMDMPTARSGFAVAVVGNRIYVIGGEVAGGYVGNNEVYDPTSNTWSTKTSMPTPRSDLCASIVDNGVYLIGGKMYSSSDPFFKETGVNEVYFPANDSWSTKEPLPTPVHGCSSAVVNGQIYVIGGSIQPVSPGTTTLVNKNQVYNTRTNNWTTAAPLPYVCSYGAAVATQGYLAPQAIYYIGGYSGGQFIAKTEVFNLANNTWSDAEAMSTPRAYLSLVTVEDKVYAIGGYDGTNWLGTNEVYKPVGYGSVPPKVQIISPENQTYKEVSLAFTVNRGVQWMGYSIDGHNNITVTSTTKLTGLSDGSHYVTMYANDSAGNMGSSDTVYFSVDTQPPVITIFSPTNQSYGSSDIQLSFTISETVASLSYSLDGEEPEEIIGNVTLPALSNGGHKVTIYAIDEIGNEAQETVYFEIAPFPTLLVIAVLVSVIIVVAAAYILFKLRKPQTKNVPERGGSNARKTKK
ncbi:MAG: Kelch repeat-containing protein [Candidatus Bathyarchaeia archaeon]